MTKQPIEKVGCAVDYIICTRNNRGILRDTLEAVARQEDVVPRIFIIDDNSNDGTPEFVESEFPHITLVRKSAGSGPAQSRNLGIARCKDSEYIAFLDSDVTLSPNWTTEQLQFLKERPDVGAVCGKLVYAAQPGIINATGGVINRYAVAWNGCEGDDASTATVPQQCLWSISAATLVRGKVVREIGGFDADLFAFYEDTEFGWRVSLTGNKVFFNPRAMGRHGVHGTMNERTMGDRILYLSRRNRIRTVLVIYEWQNLLRYGLVYLGLALADAIIRAPRKPKFAALKWNLMNLGSTFRRRAKVQATRRVRDCDLWPLFSPGFRGPGK